MMIDMDKSVSVVVVNYNNALFLKSALDALRGIPEILEIIAVDDASTDDSVEILKQYDLTLVRNEKNFGPVKSRNIGARIAKGSYLLFLDSDAKLARDYLAIVAGFLDKHPDAGVVSGKIIAESGGRMWFNFGYDPAPVRDRLQNVFDDAVQKTHNIPWLQSLLKWAALPFTLNFVHDAVRNVPWVAEMALVTRRDLFETLCGFDENLFMFFEGPDYCRRARMAGYSSYYVPDAICEHLGGHSHGETRARIFQESRAYYLKKYSGKK